MLRRDVWGLLMQYSMDAKESLLAIVSIIRPWDPGIITATALGTSCVLRGR
jgi:hypothetical protein